MSNQEFAELLYKAADVYELNNIEWKPRAYRKAARSIESLGKDIKEIYEKDGEKGLEEIPGVGQAIAKHIIEYLKTEKVKKWEALFKKAPKEYVELLSLEGLGPRKVRILTEKLGIKTINELKDAIERKKLERLEGFGVKTEENLLKSIQLHKKGEGRILLNKALPLAEEIINYLKKNSPVQKIDYAGSLRRMKETIGDIDILSSSNNPEKIIEKFTTMPNVDRVVSKGTTRSSIKLKEGIHVDLRVVPSESYSAALQYFTGNKLHNIEVRKVAIKKGYKLSEYGLFNNKTNKMIKCDTEEEIYRKLGFSYIPPELRRLNGELEAARKGKIPKILELKDIKGDLQMHSTYSDGINSVEEMANEACKMGYEYIAITDHSKSARIAHGMEIDRLNKQWKEIENISKKYKIKIIKSAEVDILPDGSLDYPESVLKKLEMVIGAIHSGFKMDINKMTERITKALENKYLDILAHPTGRLIGKREAYSVNLQKVFETAEKNNKVIEINANPERLDLNDSNIMEANKHNIKFSVNTDAHSIDQLHYMKYGVAQARRGWLTKNNVVNTYSLAKLRNIFKKIK